MELTAQRRTHRTRVARRIGGPHRRTSILPRLRLRTGRHLHEDRGGTEEPIHSWLSLHEPGEGRKVAQTSVEGQSAERHPASERAVEIRILRPDGGCSGRYSEQELDRRVLSCEFW